MTLENFVIENGTLITPFEKLDNKDGEITRIVIENGIIDFVGLEDPDKKYEGYTKIDTRDKILTPGFIDSHVHLNADFKNIDDICEKIEQQRRIFLKQGVTSYMLATMAMPDLGLEEILEAAMIENKYGDGPKLFGVVVEGPFTNPAVSGAMDTRFVSTKPKFYLGGMIDYYEDILKKIVLAPEMHPDYYEFIRKVNVRERKDVILSVGHSNASYKQAVEAINDGIRIINHFWNRVSPLHHRDLGIVGAVLRSIGNKDLYLELIADGKHVCQDAVDFTTEEIELRGKGKNWADVIMLITDAINIIAPSEIEGGYEIRKLGDEKIYYIDGAPYLDKEKKTLYGSILTMVDAVRNMISWGYNPPDVFKSATLTPAIVHYYDKQKGSLEKGKDADFLVFNKEKGGNIGSLEGVFVRGNLKNPSKNFQAKIERRKK